LRLFFHGSKTEEKRRVRIDEFALLRIEVVALSQLHNARASGMMPGLFFHIFKT
jgi:hypothetical protein